MALTSLVGGWIDLDRKVRGQIWYEILYHMHFPICWQTCMCKSFIYSYLHFCANLTFGDLHLTLIWRSQVKSDMKFEFVIFNFLSDDNTMLGPIFNI